MKWHKLELVQCKPFDRSRATYDLVKFNYTFVQVFKEGLFEESKEDLKGSELNKELDEELNVFTHCVILEFNKGIIDLAFRFTSLPFLRRTMVFSPASVLPDLESTCSRIYVR